jgi:hypothetical protein
MIAGGEGWDALEAFEAPAIDGEPDLRRWSRSLIVGRAEADALVSGLGRPSA